MQLSLRSATARPLGFDDVAALQALLGRCAAYFRGADGRAPDKNAALERISDALGDEQVRLVGFFQRDALVGLLELRLHEPSADDATIVLLLLEPLARRSGLGRELVEALVDALAREDVRALHLGVQEHEQVAHAFWQALGFHAVSEERGVTNYVRALGSDDS